MQAYKNFLLPCSAYNIRPIICFELLLSLMESTNYRCRHIYAQFLLHAYGGKCPGNCPKVEMSYRPSARILLSALTQAYTGREVESLTNIRMLDVLHWLPLQQRIIFRI